VVGRRTCDLEVIGSISGGIEAAWRNNSGQVVHTHVPQRRQPSPWRHLLLLLPLKSVEFDNDVALLLSVGVIYS